VFPPEFKEKIVKQLTEYVISVAGASARLGVSSRRQNLAQFPKRPLLASRSGLDTGEDPLSVVAAKIAELVAV